MKKIILLAIFICILLSGCLSGNSNTGETLGAFIKHFKEANTIKYNVISKETFGDKSMNKTSFANFILKRSPYDKSSISIAEQHGVTNFVKLREEEHSGKSFELSRFLTEIDESNYKIDTKGNISLKKEFENSIKLETQSMEMPQSMKQVNDHFHMLIYLIEKNSESFQLENADKNDSTITYSGFIKADSIVDYYLNDGNKVFKEMFFVNYQGEMTREALREEIIRNHYNTLGNPFHALLFINEPIPINFVKNKKENTYQIMINMVSAKKALYKTMYADMKDVSINIEESSIEFRNISLE